MLGNKLVNILNVLVLTTDLAIKFFDGFGVCGFVILVNEIRITSLVLVYITSSAINTVATLKVEFTAFGIGMIKVITTIRVLTVTALATSWTVWGGCCWCGIMLNKTVHVLFGFGVDFDVKNVHCRSEKG